MNDIFAQVDAWLIALAFALTMLASWSLGWFRGHAKPPESGEDPSTRFLDASMAILGLLLAFTFAMVLGRHDQRRLTAVTESNAIADFYTCASLLKEPIRTRLQDVIQEYARHILDTPQEALPEAEQKKVIQRNREIYASMVGLVREAVTAGTPIAGPLTNGLNNITSSNAARLAAYQEGLPWSIVVLLWLSSIVPSFLIGEKQGASHKASRSVSLSFIVLVTLVIYVTLDLNQPRRGLIRVNQNSLERVIQAIAR